MHLLPPFVTTHHQNVAFLGFLLIIVLVQQSISGGSGDPPQSSNDQSSSNGERRRPMQPRAITRSMSVRTRSRPLFLEQPVEMNKPERNSQLLLSSINTSRPPSLENTIKAFEDKEKMKNLDGKRITKTKKIQERLCDDLKQIQKNSRPTILKQLKQLFKSKSNEKTQAKNAQLSKKFLDYIPEEDACEQLLPTWDPIAGQFYKDYDPRVAACQKLNALTGWVAVKEAISAMGNSAKLSQCSTIYEDDDDDGNGIDRLSNPKPRHSLDIASERIVSRKSVDMSQTLQQNSIQRSAAAKANNFGFEFGDNAQPNSLQRSMSARPIDNGTLPRHSTSRKSTDSGNGTLTWQPSTSRKSIDSGNGTLLRHPSTSRKSTDSGNGTLTRQPSTSKKSTSKKSTNSGNDNGILPRNSLQRSTTSARPIDNGTLPRNSLQPSTSRKSTDLEFSKSKMQKNFVEGRRSLDEWNSSYAEIGDESKNLPCVLQRSSSVRNTGMARSLSVGAELFDLKADKEDVFKESILCTVQWDVLQTGMLCMRDKNVKKNILALCRRVNYELQLLILQNLLLKTRPKHDSNESSIQKREQELKIRENMLEYKQNFEDKRTDLLRSLNDRISNGQLGEEFNKALVELRDKVVAHWTWLYDQHRR